MASFTFILFVLSLLAASSPALLYTKYGITIPEECRGKGFCSIRPEGYDEIEAKINRLLTSHLVKISSRLGVAPILHKSDDDDNCPSEIIWESVYAFEHPSGTGMDIFVQTKLFPQKLGRIICKHSKSESRSLKEGAPQCFKKLGLSDFDLKFTCQESTAQRTLMVYDPEVNLIKMKNYTIPVCCSCQMSK